MESINISNTDKFKYGDLEYISLKQGSCYTVGRVYIVNNVRTPKRGLLEGDLMLCIKKSGDCFYDFVRIEKFTETSYSGIPTYQLFAYYNILDKTSCYGGMKEAFPKMETLSDSDLVHILFSDQVLIPLVVTLSSKDLLNLELVWGLNKD